MFDNNFLWGCSTAGYQVERALGNADWDIFVNTPEIRDRVHAFHERATGTIVDYEDPGEAVGHENLDVLKVELERLIALGLNAYRFSVEWNRVQPTAPPTDDPGGGVFDTAWRDHYLAVLREVLQRELKPVITLNHMSLPAWALTPPVATRIVDPFSVSNLPVAAEDDQWRSSLRGWETPETVAAYVAFVRYFATAVNDQFPNFRMIWATMNEPIGSMVGAGYLGALWCPGFGGEADRGKRVCLNLLKAHVLAYQALKAIDARWQVGFTHAMLHATPTSFSSAVAGLATGAAAGAAGAAVAGAAAGAVTGAMLGLALLGPLGLIIGAIAGAIAGAITGGVAGGGIGATVGVIVGSAQNVQQHSTDQFDYFYNEWMLRALVKAEIDTDLTVGTTRTATEWDEAWTTVIGDGAGARGSNLDFVGLNYYRRVHVYYVPLVSLFAPYTGGVFHNDMEGDADPHGVLNELGWEVFPEGLSSFLRRIKRDYDKPILVTENGTPEALDANRAASLVAHVDEIRKATEDTDAPDIWGYIHWSSVDNWEWHEDYHEKARFGLHTVGDRNPANRIRVGQATTFRRQLTEAGLALRSLIDNPDADPARSRFGAVASGGERTELPTASNGALWQGQLRNRLVKLFLDTTAPGALTGLIYYDYVNLWLSLSGLAWDANTRQLSFSHGGRALPAIPALTVRLVLDVNSHTLAGQATDPATGVAMLFNLPRVPAHGVWLPTAVDGSWSALAMHQLFDGDPVVKRLLRGDGNRWQAFRTSGTLTLTFIDADSTFELAFGTDPRDLTVSQTAGPSRDMPTVPAFRRTPSSLAILGET